MLKIDALYVLIIAELLVILTVAAVYFIIRGKKHQALYQLSLKDLEDARAEQEVLRKQLADSKTAVPLPDAGTSDIAESADAAPAADINEIESYKIELADLEMKIKEKDALISDLQAKFDDMEKEYLILYQAQQKQQG